MTALEGAARAVSRRLGRQSRVIRALRPAYNLLLYVASLGRGIWWTVNGEERFRIDPFVRQHFPEEYDPAVHSFLRQRVRPGAVVLDVGANLGIYALCLAQWAGPRGRVYAFEPNPAARKVLERHLALNHLGDGVTVLPQAISHTVGQAGFNAVGIEGWSRLGAENPVLPGGERITVPVTTLDAFCAQTGTTPDWIVLDIEGNEVAALQGARATIAAGQGRLGIVVELHPSLWQVSGTSRQELESVLRESGLRAVPLTGQRDPLAEYGIVVLEYGR